MKTEFNIAKYVEQLRNARRSYFHTFLNHQNLAAGVLVLQPGQQDTQEPHDSDEIYYVIQGDGFLRINEKDYEVQEGKSFFVKSGASHYFFGNTVELVVMYFFGGPDT